MKTHNTKRNILIIDDDRAFCDTAEDYLTSKTMEVFTAYTGADGLAICSRRKIEVVLLDQKLPDMEGVSLCPAILQQNDQTKIIFVTAYPSFNNAEEQAETTAETDEKLEATLKLEEEKEEEKKTLKEKGEAWLKAAENTIMAAEDEEAQLKAEKDSWLEAAKEAKLKTEEKARLQTGGREREKQKAEEEQRRKDREKKNSRLKLS